MWYNQLKTVVLLATLSGIFMLVGGYMGGSSGVTIAFIISLVMNYFAYFYSDKMVLKMYNAQELNKNQYPEIYNMVQELTAKDGIPMPKLYLINTPMANAFATGRNPQHASVAVTTGILGLLDLRELRGVLAHEISHVKNRDILISTIAATIATAIGYAANLLRFMSIAGDNDNRKRNPLVMLLLVIFMPIAASLIQLAISRSREYMADESGAHLCEDPMALASALKKLQMNIGQHHLHNDDTSRAMTAHLFIVQPFTAGSLSALFSSHPPMAQRIAQLQEIYASMNKPK